MSRLDRTKTVSTVIDIARYTNACDVTVWTYDVSNGIPKSSTICKIRADDADVTHVHSEQIYRVEVHLGKHMIIFNGDWVNYRNESNEMD